MKIKYLKVIFDDTTKYCYEFSDKSLIFSHDNSKGKTTLLRFLLYALGYQVPATEGIGNFENIKFEISLVRDSNDIKVLRSNNNIEVIVNNTIEKYILPIQETELFSLIFGIDNTVVLNNLLAVFYIDQEKGWTLLNRGKIIGNIRFNIEEFIAGISEINIENLLNEKRTLNSELKKYRYFKNVIDINSEFSDDVDDKPLYDLSNMSDLIQEQKEIELQLKKATNNRRKIMDIINKNKLFADMIEDYGLVIRYNDEEFVLTKDKLVDFEKGQDLLKIKANNYKIEEEKLKIKLNNILQVINEKNTLFSVDDILENMEKTVENIGIDVNRVDKIIKQLSNKRNTVNKQIKDALAFNNFQLLRFYEIIEKYAKELGIEQFISERSPKFVLTNKLKGLSGRVLAQMSYIFKLSYIKAIEEKYGLVLPIIIDSPRTNELSEDSTNDMLNILKRDFYNHQIIMASIYENNIIQFDVINLDNKLFSEKYILNN